MLFASICFLRMFWYRHFVLFALSTTVNVACVTKVANMTIEELYRLIVVFSLSALSVYCTIELMHGNHFFLIMVLFATIFILMSVRGRYAPYLAFSLVNPLTVLPQIPINQFPIYALIILACCLKQLRLYIHAFNSQEIDLKSKYFSSIYCTVLCSVSP